MALSDLLLVSANTSFNYYFLRQLNWPFGETLCAVNNFLAAATVSSCALNLMAMSVDRYMAIAWPLRARTSPKSAFSAMVVIWFASFAFASPAAIFSETQSLTLSLSVSRSSFLRHFRS